MRVGSPTPILRIFNEAAAKQFYLAFLGFSLDWEHRFEPGLPLYMQVVKGDCILHLSEHHGDACPGAALRIPVDDLDTFCSSLTEKRYAYARPSIDVMPWGSRDMAITDPFGNRLVFTSPDEA